jgi:hypothetical protein
MFIDETMRGLVVCVPLQNICIISVGEQIYDYF